MRNKYLLSIACATTLLLSCQSNKNFEVIVAGGGASGTCAAIQSARLGTKTLLIERTAWLGGMLTSAGVSAVDGDYHLPSGLWGEFRDALANHYGSLDALKTGWVSNVLFEPSVGNEIFNKWTAAEPQLKCYFNTSIEEVVRTSNGWKLKIRQKGKRQTVKTSYLIDATELGDVAKAAGLPYHAGMDSNKDTGEPQAPDKENNIVQDLTYAITVRKFDTPQLIARPKDYDPLEFRNCCTCQYNDSTAKGHLWSPEMMLSYGQLPNGKYMLNWSENGNDFYLNDIECTQAQRDSLENGAKAKSIRYLYFLQHEVGMTNLGLADEYPTADHFPLMPYYREGRRFEGVVRFTLNDISAPYSQDKPLYRTAIAVGDYPVDHHHHEYKGSDIPTIKFPMIPSYGIPLGVVIPQKEDRLLLAEKAVSVTNLVNGTTRLQPVVMQLGQVAAVVACLALKHHCTPREVSVHEVQNVLLDNGNYLLPYLDVEKTDPTFKSLQRIGVMGILHGIGKHIDWSNETWINADSLLYSNELEGLASVYPTWKAEPNNHAAVTLKALTDIIKEIGEQNHLSLSSSQTVDQQFNDICHRFKLGNPEHERPITRKQAAVVIDQFLGIIKGIGDQNHLSPFSSQTIDQQVSDIYHRFKLGNPEYERPITRKQAAVLIDQLLHPFETIDVNLYGKFSASTAKYIYTQKFH